MTETQHVIALNPYRKGNKGKVFSNSMAVYDKVIASPEIRKMIQQIRGELPIPKVNANDAEEKSRKCLLISWLQSPSAVIWEPQKIKSDTISPSISHEVMGPDAMILFSEC